MTATDTVGGACITLEVSTCSVTVSVFSAVPAVLLIGADTPIAGWLALSVPFGAVVSGPPFVTSAWSSAGVGYTGLTVVLGWSVAAVTVWVTFAGVFVAAFASPVVVALAEAVEVAVSIVGALGAAFVVGSMASMFLLAETVAWSDVHSAALAFPVFVTHTVSVVVEVSILNALVAVAGAWAPAAFAFIVTPSLVDATVVSCPPVVTSAVFLVLTWPWVRDLASVVHAVLTVAAVRSSTSVTDRVAFAHVVDTSVINPVVVADACSVVVWVEVSVGYADVTVACLFTVAGVTGVEAVSSPGAAVISGPVVLADALVVFVPLCVRYTDVTVAVEWAVAGAADWVAFTGPY